MRPPAQGRWRGAAAALVLMASLAACSDGDEEDSGDAAPATTSTTTAPVTSTTPPSDSSTTAPPTTVSSRPPALRASLVASFDQPVMLAPVPRADDTFYVLEKPGRIRLLAGGRPGAVVLNITGDVSTGGERGLLGLAVHPDGGHLYLNYTDTSGDTRVVEYAIGAGGAVDRSSRLELLRVDQPYANHNGGHLEFGPDGMLYVALGDGGSGGDPDGRAQDLGELLGKILRIEPRPGDTAAPYGVPADNPFNGDPGARREIWAYGLRNPWRFSFDRATGSLWIGDVGQNRREEIDRSPPGSKGGENYGWDRLEGRSRFEGEPPAEHELPVHDYGRDDGACSVTGGRVYRGSRIADLAGWYVFGDYCRKGFWALRADAEGPADAVPVGEGVPSLVSFAEDGAGELYALSLDGGVYRIERASP
ncbi:MAG TPA: PQQ-dependent sugar dehydrogenase [Acidimicrobiales bacterium]|nr:PQQ-dependent sugar dehydrogenase [Acidimicrobiales bacterium]